MAPLPCPVRFERQAGLATNARCACASLPTWMCPHLHLCRRSLSSRRRRWRRRRRIWSGSAPPTRRCESGPRPWRSEWGGAAAWAAWRGNGTAAHGCAASRDCLQQTLRVGRHWCRVPGAAAAPCRAAPSTHAPSPIPPPCLSRRIASFKDLSLDVLRSAGTPGATAGPGTERGGGGTPLPPLLRELHSDESGGGLGAAAAPAVQAASSGGSAGTTGCSAGSGSSGSGARRPPFEQRVEELRALASRWGCGSGSAAGLGCRHACLPTTAALSTATQQAVPPWPHP